MTNKEAPERSFKLLFALLMLGVIGVASLMAMPLETLLPDGIEVPRALLLIQPTVLVLAFTAAGWWAAPKAGLGAPYLTAGLERWAMPKLPPMIGASLLVALAGGAVLLGYAALTRDIFAGTAAPDLPQPLVTRLLYGGVAEELLARWGILSLAMLGLLKLKAGPGAAFWSANLLAAVLFGVGHFGMLFSVLPDPPVWLLLAVLVGNMVPALGYGWLFRRFGIEAAMLAHAGTHLVAVGGTSLLGG